MITRSYQKLYQDKCLTCLDCGDSFLFEAGEQAFFESKHLSIPKRCPECRKARRLTLVPDKGKEVPHE